MQSTPLLMRPLYFYAFFIFFLALNFLRCASITLDVFLSSFWCSRSLLFISAFSESLIESTFKLFKTPMRAISSPPLSSVNTALVAIDSPVSISSSYPFASTRALNNNRSLLGDQPSQASFRIGGGLVEDCRVIRHPLVDRVGLEQVVLVGT